MDLQKFNEKISQQHLVILKQLSKFRSSYQYRTIQAHQISGYIHLLTYLSELISAYLSGYSLLISEQMKQDLFSINKNIINDLLSKVKYFGLQKLDNKVNSQQKKEICNVCKGKIKQLQIKQQKDMLTDDAGMRSYLLGKIYQDQNANLFTQDQDLVFFAYLNKLLIRKQEVLSMQTKQVTHYLQSVTTSLSNLNLLNDVTASNFKLSDINPHTQDQINKDVMKSLKTGFQGKIQPWIKQLVEKIKKSLNQKKSENNKQYGVQTSENHLATFQYKKRQQNTTAQFQKQIKRLKDQITQYSQQIQTLHAKINIYERQKISVEQYYQAEIHDHIKNARKVQQQFKKVQQQYKLFKLKSQQGKFNKKFSVKRIASNTDRTQKYINEESSKQIVQQKQKNTNKQVNNQDLNLRPRKIKRLSANTININKLNSLLKSVSKKNIQNSSQLDLSDILQKPVQKQYIYSDQNQQNRINSLISQSRHQFNKQKISIQQISKAKPLKQLKKLKKLTSQKSRTYQNDNKVQSRIDEIKPLKQTISQHKKVQQKPQSYKNHTQKILNEQSPKKLKSNQKKTKKSQNTRTQKFTQTLRQKFTQTLRQKFTQTLRQKSNQTLGQKSTETFRQSARQTFSYNSHKKSNLNETLKRNKKIFEIQEPSSQKTQQHKQMRNKLAQITQFINNKRRASQQYKNLNLNNLTNQNKLITISNIKQLVGIIKYYQSKNQIKQTNTISIQTQSYNQGDIFFTDAQHIQSNQLMNKQQKERTIISHINLQTIQQIQQQDKKKLFSNFKNQQIIPKSLSFEKYSIIIRHVLQSYFSNPNLDFKHQQPFNNQEHFGQNSQLIKGIFKNQSNAKKWSPSKFTIDASIFSQSAFYSKLNLNRTLPKLSHKIHASKLLTQRLTHKSNGNNIRLNDNFQGSFRHQNLAQQKQQQNNLSTLFDDTDILLLFSSQSNAYEYQRYLKKNTFQIVKSYKFTNAQIKHLEGLYTTLVKIKQQSNEIYHKICSYIRYPYQTVKNGFDIVNIAKDMNQQTFIKNLQRIFTINHQNEKKNKSSVKPVYDKKQSKFKNFIKPFQQKINKIFSLTKTNQ